MGRMALPQLLREDNRRAPVEGETFSSNPAHPYWRVKVRFTTGLKPSIERIRAATAAQALEFVCARYPFASRSGSEVLGRWDAESTPIDPKAPVEKPAPIAPRCSPMPTRDRRPAAPLQPPSAAKPAKEERPVLGADLERLPRDRCGRAVIDESVIPRAVAANDGGLSWPVIADMLGCGEKNLRERAGKWKRLQKARQDAAEALEPVTTADPTDTRLWDVFGPQQRLLASRQPSELSCRLMTALSAAGVSCSRSVSEDQPTPAPVITPTKAGGFMVQVTVNPLESGG